MAAAVAASYDVEIGSAIAVPQIRNPIDLASAMATISELHPNRRLTLGMGAGSGSVTGQKLEMTRKYAIAEEMACFLRTLLDGKDANRADFPILSSYFHLKADKFRLRFSPKSAIDLYYGFSGTGARTTSMISKYFDGVIVQTRLLAIEEMERSIATLHQERERLPGRKKLGNVLMLNSSVSHDEGAALEGAKRFVSHIVPSTPPELLQRRGIIPDENTKLKQSFVSNQGLGAAASLTSDELVRKVLVAGTPAQVAEEIADIFKFAERCNFDHIMIGSPVGPDPAEAIDIWAKELLPALV